MYVHVGDIHRVTPCVIVRYTDYVCKTQNLFYKLTLNYRVLYVHLMFTKKRKSTYKIFESA